MAAAEVHTHAEPADPATGISPGSVLECHTSGITYAVERRLGAGAFGSVWLCREDREEQLRAVKVLSTHRAQEQAAEVACMRRAVEAVQPFHVPKLHDSGEASVRGQPGPPHLLIAMEFINGATASNLAADAPPMHFFCASTILGDVASALARLHANGLIHRDVKGDNVMVSDWGHSYLCDFGVSGLEEELSTNGGRFVVGTPDFMAPELLGRVPFFSHKADVWAFGIFAFELTMGRTPARDPRLMLNTAERVMAHTAQNNPPDAPEHPGYPAGYAEAVNSCLVRDPAERPDIEELAERNRFVRRQGEDGYRAVRQLLRERDQPSATGGLPLVATPLQPWNPFEAIPSGP